MGEARPDRRSGGRSVGRMTRAAGLAMIRRALWVGLLLLTPFAVYWQTVFHEYGFRDDYSLLREVHEEPGKVIRLTVSNGRPIYGMALDASLRPIRDVPDLPWLRLFAVALLAGVAVVLWRQLRTRGMVRHGVGRRRARHRAAARRADHRRLGDRVADCARAAVRAARLLGRRVASAAHRRDSNRGARGRRFPLLSRRAHVSIGCHVRDRAPGGAAARARRARAARSRALGRGPSRDVVREPRCRVPRDAAVFHGRRGCRGEPHAARARPAAQAAVVRAPTARELARAVRAPRPLRHVAVVLGRRRELRRRSWRSVSASARATRRTRCAGCSACCACRSSRTP